MEAIGKRKSIKKALKSKPVTTRRKFSGERLYKNVKTGFIAVSVTAGLTGALLAGDLVYPTGANTYQTKIVRQESTEMPIPFTVTNDKLTKKMLQKEGYENVSGIVTSNHTLRHDGKLVNIPGKSVPKQSVRSVDKALLSITNFDYPGIGWAGAPKVTHAFLKNEGQMNAFIEDAFKIIVENGYKGINLDFENIFWADREKYTNFIKKMKTKFSEKNLKITICVPQKYGDRMNRAYDFKTLAKYCDEIIIMNYDEHVGTKGPVASTKGTMKTIRYIKKTVGSLEKFAFALPGYGRAYSDKEKGHALTNKQISKIIKDKNLEIKYNENYGAPYVEYDDPEYGTRTIFFADNEALISLVKSRGADKIYWWRLGLEGKKDLEVFSEGKRSQYYMMGDFVEIAKPYVERVEETGEYILDKAKEKANEQSEALKEKADEKWEEVKKEGKEVAKEQYKKAGIGLRKLNERMSQYIEEQYKKQFGK